jgi:multisubunit Na+/H+ antiporter MnhB subunit
MVFLYGTGLLYGVGTGIWADALGKLNDPGLAFIAPLAIGAAIPIGIYFWDDYAQLHRGVPSSIATGLSLGALEGIAISGTQWQHSGSGGPNAWSFSTEATVTWSLATVGGLGGYAFGEWLRPDPRSLGFISGGAGWGAIAGTLFGAGLGSGDWRDGASIAGLVGYNVGILATGALSVVYVPSWQTQKWMWAGFAGGTVAASVVYLFYIGSKADPRHGLIANAVGGAAGLGLAAILTANMTDAGSPTVRPGSAWTPPFQFGITPVMNPGTNQRTGAVLSAVGAF